MKTLIKIATLTIFAMVAPARAMTSRWESLPLPAALPVKLESGYVERAGARIWFGVTGKGPTVVLLHGGIGSSESWGNQISALADSHHRVVLIDTRGHGRSTLGVQPLSYEVFEADVRAVMDALHVERADIIGWSDGANTALVMAMKDPSRLHNVYAFGANMSIDAIAPSAFSSPILSKVAGSLQQTYINVSPTPHGFNALHQAVEAMQRSEPNYSAAQLAAIRGPRIAIADGDHEEFIKLEHTKYLAKAIPGATLVILPDVSHFAPWQDPETFNASILNFLK